MGNDSLKSHREPVEPEAWFTYEHEQSLFDRSVVVDGTRYNVCLGYLLLSLVLELQPRPLYAFIAHWHYYHLKYCTLTFCLRVLI